MNKQMSSALVYGDNTPVILQGIQEQNFTITTLEIAEMMNVEHKKVLRKLQGDKDRKGIIQVLTESQMGVSDYFKESTYIDSSGKTNKCYDCTKMGCELLANKFTGEKGIIFSAKYVERFNKMEAVLRNQLISSYNLLSQQFSTFSQSLEEKINKLEAQAEFNHRPSHATKLNWNRIIKTYSKCSADEENIKALVFENFGISKWEDLTADKFTDVFAYIRGIAEKANLINQMSLFDREER